MIVVLVLKSLKEIIMKQLSRFKVVQNMLVYGDYKISLTPYHKFTVYYQDKEMLTRLHTKQSVTTMVSITVSSVLLTLMVVCGY